MPTWKRLFLNKIKLYDRCNISHFAYNDSNLCCFQSFKTTILYVREQRPYLQPIITQYFIDNKSEIWLLFLIAHSKR